MQKSAGEVHQENSSHDRIDVTDEMRDEGRVDDRDNIFYRPIDGIRRNTSLPPVPPLRPNYVRRIRENKI